MQTKTFDKNFKPKSKSFNLKLMLLKSKTIIKTMSRILN